MVEIAQHIETVARHLLGAPNRVLSKPGRELRFGSRGSIAVDLKKGVWHDHERGEGGGVLDLIIHQGKANNRPDAAAWLKENGFARGDERAHRRAKQTPPCGGPARKHDDAGNQGRAQSIWRQAGDPRGTVAERYLIDERDLPLFEELAGAVLRFHPRLWLDKGHPSVPGLVAAFRPIADEKNSPPPQAIHRIFLRSDGTALRDGNGDRIKWMLGPVVGCAIKLSPHKQITGELGVAEGLETALAVMAAGWRPVWALGSAGAIEQFPVLPDIKRLAIFADNDASGAGQHAAEICAERWLRVGIKADIYTTQGVGTDWADAWAARGRRT